MFPIDIAIVVHDSSNPDSLSEYWYDYFDAKDYINNITYEDVNTVSQATLNTYDLVFAGGGATSADYVKLKGLVVPVVFCSYNLKDELKFGLGGTTDVNETQIDIFDNTHYITDSFAEETITIQTNQALYNIWSPSQGVTKLANRYGVQVYAVLLVLEKGDLHIDETVCTERMVFWGVFDASALLKNGDTITEKIFEWCMYQTPITTPVFDPAEGLYYEEQDVTISAEPVGITIKYTIDLSEPSRENGIVYIAPIHVSETTTIKAMAWKDGLDDTEVVTVVISIRAPVDVAYTLSDPENPNDFDTDWKTYLEAKDYINSVTYEDFDTVTQEELNAYDLVFVPPESGGPCKGLVVPVLCFNRYQRDVLKLGINVRNEIDAHVDIIENTHYITEVFELGLLHVNVSGTTWVVHISDWSQDVICLATENGDNTWGAVIVLDKDGKHIDETICTERIVFCGIDPYRSGDYATDGETLFDRIVGWLLYEDTVQVATPRFDPVEGEYIDESQDVTITCATEGATVKYTIDGSEPSQENGITYTEPIHIVETTTLKAMGFKDECVDSYIRTALYIIRYISEVVTKRAPVTIEKTEEACVITETTKMCRVTIEKTKRCEI